MRVLKYRLQIIDGEQPVEMPVTTRVVFVEMQRGSICLWAVVTSDLVEGARRFAVFGTGRPARGEYVGSVIDGDFVWHVFEV